MAAILKVHTPPNDDELNVKVGDEFEIVDEDDNLVAIMVNGFELAFSKEPDELGLSYRTWFDLVE